MEKKPPAVDTTERDLEPVDSSAGSLAPVPTDPAIPVPAQDTRDALPPVATLDTDAGTVPLAKATSTTQLLDDDVVAGPTHDVLPKVPAARVKEAAAPAPSPELHAPEVSAPKKPAGERLEASSAPLSRKLPRRKLVGREDQFEAGTSEPSLHDVPGVEAGDAAGGGAVRFVALLFAAAVGVALLLVWLAWLVG